MERISNVKKCSVIDSGLPEQYLFEEMEQLSKIYYFDKDGVQRERETPLGRSLWYKILRAIQKYPRF